MYMWVGQVPVNSGTCSYMQRRYDRRGAAQAISLCNDVGRGRNVIAEAKASQNSYPPTHNVIAEANCLSCTTPVVPPLSYM